jgi:hypothetical protein
MARNRRNTDVQGDHILQHSRISTSNSPVPDVSRTSRGSHSTRSTLSAGLSRLIEGQHRFAQEFGIANDRVFSDAFEAFKGQPSIRVIDGWLDDGSEGARRLDGLLRDLADHQVALVSAVQAGCNQIETVRPSLCERLWTRLRRCFAVVSGRGGAEHRVQNGVLAAMAAGYSRERDALRAGRGRSDGQLGGEND